MRISKEKLASLKSRARGIGRRAAGGAKGTALGAGVGVAGFFAHSMASSKIEAVNKHPMLAPLAMAAAGHFLKKKSYDAGQALCGAAGYAGAMQFQAQKQSTPSSSQARGWDDDAGSLITPGFAQLEAAGEPMDDFSAFSQAPGEMGAVVNPGDVGDVSEAWDLTG